MSRVPFLNSYIDCLSMNDTLDRIREHIKQRVPIQHVVVNAGKIVQMHQDHALLKKVNNCGIINADGMAVVWAARLLGNAIPERVAGIDLMFNLLHEAEREEWPIYLLGASDKVLSQVIVNLQSSYPSLRIAGHHHGYFSTEQEQGIVNDIAQSGTRILLVAISSPKKELFISRYFHQLQVSFCMGVGGSFDIIAGVTQRAPQWMQASGLEWFYRFLQEPGRMWKRYLVGNSKFIALVIQAKWNQIRRRTHETKTDTLR